MRLKLSITLATLCLAYATSALAVPISGQGNPTDDPNLAGGTVIDFDSGPIGNVSPAITLDEVTFTAIGGNDISDFFIADGSLTPIGSNNSRGIAALSTLRGGVRTIEFGFANPVEAFGFLLGGTNSIWNLTAFDSDDQEIESMTISPVVSSNAGDYVGFAAEDIASAILTQNLFDDAIIIDNFTFTGAGVPEPGTILLFGVGLIGIQLLRRRERCDVRF